MALKNVKPNIVSRDLSSYVTFVYGQPKVGKTTFAASIPGSLILAFEPGYKLIPGAEADDITSWSEFRKDVRDLKDKEYKDKYKAVIIDTVDIACQMCEKYICMKNDVEELSQIPYGGGWSQYKKELEDNFRLIHQLGYALIFISHDKDTIIKRQDQTEYNLTQPTVQSSASKIIEGMADIMCYAYESSTTPGLRRPRLVLRSMDGSCVAGGRVKYLPNEIDFTYEALSKALSEAIDKEAKEHGSLFTTDERAATTEAVQLDYTSLVNEFNDIVTILMRKDQNVYAPKVTQIVEKYLGKGKKFSDTTPSQVELIDLIVSEIKEL